MENLIKTLVKIGDGINAVFRVLLGVATLVLCYAVIGQFILRWVGMSMPWASEFACYTFVVTTMLGSALASRHLMHIGVDIITNMLQGNVKKVVLTIANIIAIAVLVLFIYASTKYTIQQIPQKFTTFTCSKAVFYVFLPISGVVMLYYTLVQTLEILYYGGPKKVYLPGDEEEGGNN